MTVNTTRSSLLLRLRDGSDTSAWREFEEQYGELITRYCLRRGLQAADADDVRQIVMLRLAKSIQGFDYDPARGRFRDYLGRIVRNAVFRHLARPKAVAAEVYMEDLAGQTAEEDRTDRDQWEEEWLLHHYRRAIETLRATYEPRSLEAFDRLVSGESIHDVASRFSTTTQAIHKIKQRIVRRVRAIVAGQIRAEDQSNA